jgi:large subunit ribosomal protein L25
MNVLLKANVPLRLIGVAPAVKDFGAVIYQDLESLEVEALPANLPEFIEVDISGLKEIGSHISVFDLKLSADVEILDEPNAVIAAAIASAASIEEEAEAAAAAEAAAEPELVERKRGEEDFED